MNNEIVKNKKSDIKIHGFQIWVIGKQFPDANDFEDGNWLNVIARCKTAKSEIWTEGAIINLPELSAWLSELKEVNKTLKGKASLNCIEPNLRVQIKMGLSGQATLTVNITPDHLLEQHECIFEIDQSYFSSLIADLKNVLNKYTIR